MRTGANSGQSFRHESRSARLQDLLFGALAIFFCTRKLNWYRMAEAHVPKP
jgi:hypothetical protein